MSGAADEASRGRNLTIRPFRDGDEDGILALFNDVFAEDDPGFRPRTRAAWDWEFAHAPAGHHTIVAVDGDGRIVAQYAGLLAHAEIDGREVTVSQGVDTVVHRDHRRGLKRQGAFLGVAETYFATYGVPEHLAFTYGLPNHKVYRIGTKRLGYRPVAAPVPTLGRNLPNFATDDDVARGADDGSVVAVERFDARVDELWSRLRDQHPIAIRRDARYLDWRFVECPLAEHRIFALVRPDGSWRAYCVVRPDWLGHPILAIADWLSDERDEAATAALLRHVCAFARAHGQLRVEIWLPRWKPQFEQVRARGFTAEQAPFNLCIRIHDPALPAERAELDWYYTIADSDLF